MDEKFKFDYPVKTPETVISGLIELEREMTNRTIELLRERHRHEKDEWTKLYNEREKELNAIRSQLAEMESKIKKLQDEHAEERKRETEAVRITLEELKKRKELEQTRWQTVEAEIKDLRRVVQETENKYQQEVKRFEYFKNLYETKEKEWSKKLQEKEEELLKIKEENTAKEQEWLKLRMAYEEKIVAIENEISNLNRILTEERVSHANIIEKKDAQIQEINTRLQEATAMISEQKTKNQELMDKLASREGEFKKIEKQYQTLLSQIDEERKRWKEAFQKEHDEWQTYRKEMEEREQILKFETEEQIRRVNELLSTLEKQLAEERKKCRELESDNLNKSEEINKLRDKLATESKNWETLLTEERASLMKQQTDIIMQYEKLRRLKDEELRNLREETTSLRGAVSEITKLHEIEKTKRIELEKKTDALEIDKKNLIAQSETERVNARNLLLEERERYEKRIQEIRSLLENVKKAREEEVNNLTNELHLLQGQFNELRALFQTVSIERDDKAAKIKDLEAQIETLTINWANEKNKLFDGFEKERENYELKLSEYLDMINQLQSQILAERTKNTEFISQLQIQNADLNEKLKSLQNENVSLTKSLQEKISEFESKYRQFTISAEREKDFWKNKFTDVTKKLEDIHKIYEAQIKNLEAQITVTKSEMNKLEALKIQESEKSQELARRLEEYIKEYNEMKTKLEMEISEQKEKLRAVFDDLLLERKTKEGVINEIKIKDERIKVLEKNIEAIQSEILFYKTEYEKQVALLSERTKSAEMEKKEIIGKYEVELERLNSVIRGLESGLHDATKRYDDLNREYEILLKEISLSKQEKEQMTKFIEEQKKIYENRISELEAYRNIIVKQYETDLKHINDINRKLSEQISQLHNELAEKTRIIEEFEFNMKSLEKQLLIIPSITKERDDLLKEVATLNDKINSLNKQIQELNRIKDETTAQRDMFKMKSNSIESLLVDLRNKHSEFELELLRKESIIHGLQSEIENMKKVCETKSVENADLKKLIEEKTKYLHEIINEKTALERKIKDMETQILTFVTENENLRMMSSSLSELNETLTKDKNTLIKELNEKTKELNDLKVTIEVTQERLLSEISSKERALNEKSLECEVLKSRVNELDKKLEDMKLEKDGLLDSLKSLEARFTDIKHERDHFEKSFLIEKDLREKITSDMIQKLQSERERIKKLEFDLFTMIEENKDLKMIIDGDQKKITELEEERNSILKELQELNRKMDEKAKEVAELQAMLETTQKKFMFEISQKEKLVSERISENEALKTRIADVEKHLLEIISQREKMEEEIHSLKSQISELKHERDLLERAVISERDLRLKVTSDTMKELDVERNKLRKLEFEISDLTKENENLKKKIEKDGMEILSLEKKIAELKTESDENIKRLNEQIELLKTERVNLVNELDKKSRTIETMIKDLESKERLLSKISTEKNELQEEIKLLNETISRMRNEIKISSDKIKELTSVIETITYEKDEIEHDAGTFRTRSEEQIKKLNEQIGNLRNEKVTLLEEINKKSQTIDDLLKEVELKGKVISQLDMEKGKLEGEVASLNEKLSKLREEFEVSNDRIQTLLTRIAELEYEKGLLEKSVASERDLRLKVTSDMMKELDTERDKLKKLESEISGLIKENEDLRKKTERDSVEISSLKKKIAELKIESDENIKRLNEQIESLKSERMNLVNELDKKSKTIEIMIKDLESKERLLSKITTGKNELQEEVKVLNESIGKMKNEIKISSDKIKELTSVIDTVTREKEVLEREAGAFRVKSEEQIKKLNEQIENLKAERMSLAEELKKKSKTVEELMKEAESKENMISQLNMEKSKLKGEISSLNEKLSKLRAEFETSNDKVQTLLKQIDELTLQRNTLEKEKKMLEERTNVLFSEHQSLKTKLLESEDTISKLQTTISYLNSKIVILEKGNKDLRTNLEVTSEEMSKK